MTPLDNSRAATSALASAGGGTLLFSAGAFLTGPFNLSSNTSLLVENDATILSYSGDAEDWPLVLAPLVWPQYGIASDCDPTKNNCWYMHQPFIFSWCTHDILLGGNGIIDAQGQAWWDCAHALDHPPCSGAGRPHLLMLSNVTDVEMRDLHIQNSPDWTLHFSTVTNLWVHNVTVKNPSSTPGCFLEFLCYALRKR